jgi:cytochrome c-type biogenesis protein CcmE
VVVAILIAAAAVVVHGSFRGSSRVETPSTLLADHSIWGARIRLVGLVATGSVKPRPGGVRFAIDDEGGTGRVTVHYTGDIPNELRGDRVVDVTGTFDGHAFEAQANTLAAICGRGPRQEHC